VEGHRGGIKEDSKKLKNKEFEAIGKVESGSRPGGQKDSEKKDSEPGKLSTSGRQIKRDFRTKIVEAGRLRRGKNMGGGGKENKKHRTCWKLGNTSRTAREKSQS